MNADIDLLEFERLWPEGGDDELIALIRGDLEDGIIHTPSTLVRGRLKTKEWLGSLERFRIAVGLEALRTLDSGVGRDEVADVRTNAHSAWTP